MTDPGGGDSPETEALALMMAITSRNQTRVVCKFDIC
jgi:hypothetical protein